MKNLKLLNYKLCYDIENSFKSINRKINSNFKYNGKKYRFIDYYYDNNLIGCYIIEKKTFFYNPKYFMVSKNALYEMIMLTLKNTLHIKPKYFKESIYHRIKLDREEK